MLSGRNAGLFDVEPGATYVYHCPLKVFTAAVSHVDNRRSTLLRVKIATVDERSHQYKQQTYLHKCFALCFQKYTP